MTASVWNVDGMILTGETKTLGEKPVPVTSVQKIRTRSSLVSNQGLRDDRPAT
jgi:hypothetical protein